MLSNLKEMKRFLTKSTVCSAAMLSFLLGLNSPTYAAETVKLGFEEAVKLALENNRLIEQSEEDREAARWYLSAIRRSSGLRFTWNSSAMRIGGRYYHPYRTRRYSIYSLSPEERDYNGISNISNYPLYQSENTNSFSLSMPLYTGGQLENQRESARYGLNSADLNLENAKQQVKWQTAQAYYQALEYKDVIAVRQEAINLLTEHLRTVRIQFEVGTVAMADVLATNVQLANNQQALNTARGNYENALATLSNIIGLPADTNLVLNENLNYATYDKSEEYCLEYALAHRPDGIAATYAAKQAEASVNSTKAGSRPNVSAVIQGSMSGEGAFKADHTKEMWSAGIQLSWNIFDNQVTAAQVQQAKATQRKAESIARQQLEQIRLEIRSAYTNLKIAEKNIAVMKNAVGQAEEQFLIAQVRYLEGVDTNLTVMDAQEKLTEAHTNYSSALYNYNTSRAALEKAMGVPIGIDAALYAASVAEGKVSAEALKDSAQMPLSIFDEKGKIKNRSTADIKPIRESATEDSVSPFEETED